MLGAKNRSKADARGWSHSQNIPTQIGYAKVEGPDPAILRLGKPLRNEELAVSLSKRGGGSLGRLVGWQNRFLRLDVTIVSQEIAEREQHLPVMWR